MGKIVGTAVKGLQKIDNSKMMREIYKDFLSQVGKNSKPVEITLAKANSIFKNL